MCPACPVEDFCEHVYSSTFAGSEIMIGVMPRERRGRMVICLRELGVESQHLIMAAPAAFALIEALAQALRRASGG